jgi:hypothetical protein
MRFHYFKSNDDGVHTTYAGRDMCSFLRVIQLSPGHSNKGRMERVVSQMPAANSGLCDALAKGPALSLLVGYFSHGCLMAKHCL